ncbi:MAG: DUF1565 domain-containing protein [Lentisphaerae bacterium]|nr:DUF1565 domain-containing protein [Lentisphaerota bacterium]
MRKILCLLLLCFTALLGAKEYFVALNGSDTAPGSKERPLATFKKAIELMQPGDTLTIMPGEYRQVIDGSFLRTSPDKRTTIRAMIPGTVLIRGDVDATAFKKVPGTLFTYVCPWEDKIEAVYEKDTFSTYAFRGTPDGLDFERGVCAVDPEKKLLYVVTTDGRAPEHHSVTISVSTRYGVLIGRHSAAHPTHNVLLEGISVTGFNLSGNAGGRPSPVEGIKGVYLRNSIIRNCDVTFCGGGIRLWRPVDCVIDTVRTFCNGVSYSGSGGNIIVNGPALNCIIRNCDAFGSPTAGIRYYGGTITNSHIINCRGGFNGYGDMWCKGIADGKSFIENCTALGSIYPSSKVPGMASTERNNVYYYVGYCRNPNSIMTLKSTLNFDRTFADPGNWDYRLQAGTGLKAGLKSDGNIYFLSPKGSDANDGKSIVTPWKTLKKIPAGSTVYLMPGVYAPFRIDVPNVRFAGRGIHGNVIIKGGRTGMEITAPGVTVKRINFVGQSGTPVVIKASDVTVTNCGFASEKAAVKAAKVKNITLTHCAFTGVPYEFNAVSGNVHSNIMAKPGKKDAASLVFHHSNAFPVKTAEAGSRVIVPVYQDAANGSFLLRNPSSFNGRGMLGFPVGPWRRLEYRDLPVTHKMQIHAASAKSATLEFFNAVDKVEHQIQMGEAPSKMKIVIHRWRDKLTPFRTFTFNGLKPGTKYFFRVDTLMPKRLILSNEDIGPEMTAKLKKHFKGKILEFTTASRDLPAKEYHVSVKGSDSNPGTAEKPLKTISRAAGLVKAGDTVTVHGGVYNESVRLRAGGEPGRPITFRAAPKEKVFWEGANQKYTCAFSAQNKSHVYIDGFRFRLFSGRTHGNVILSNGRDFKVTRCIFDGRGPNYSGGSVYGEDIKDLLVQNCMIVRGFQGMTLYNCDNVTLKNNLFLVNQLSPLALGYSPMNLTVTNNIIFDTIITKQTNVLMASVSPDKMKIENNCFYLRIPPSERLATGSLMGAVTNRMTFTAYRKMKGGKETNIFVNPGIPAVPQIAAFKSMADRNRNYQKFLKSENEKENGKLASGAYKWWDWPELFPTNPLCKKKTAGSPMGPDPAAFKDIL